MSDQSAAFRLADDISRIGGPEARIDGHLGGADARDGKNQVDICRAIVQPDADPATRLDASRDQATCQRVNLHRQFGKGFPLPPECQRFAPAPAYRRQSRQVSQGGGRIPRRRQHVHNLEPALIIVRTKKRSASGTGC